MPVVDYDTPSSKFNLRNTAYLDPCDEEDGLDTLVVPAAWAAWLRTYTDDASDPSPAAPIRLRDRVRLHDIRHLPYAYTLRLVLIHYQEDWNRRRLLKPWSRSKNNVDSTAEHPGTNVPDEVLPRICFETEIDYIIPTWLNDEAIRRWRYIVSDYTGMDLTEQRDRLPAIAANLQVRFDSSKDNNVSCRPIRVWFMGGYATFIPDYDLTMAATPLHSDTHGSRSMLYEFTCIGDFNVERNDATISETQSDPGASLALSLVIHRAAEGVYTRVGILERRRVQDPKFLEQIQRNEIRSSPSTFIKRLHEQLRESKEKNGQEEAWKHVSGLVLI
ncbi:unnamed protein product [Alternaria alternata]